MSFNPFEDKHPSLFEQILLATIPAFVGALLPPVVMHFLEKGKPSHNHHRHDDHEAPKTKRKSSKKAKKPSATLSEFIENNKG